MADVQPLHNPAPGDEFWDGFDQGVSWTVADIEDGEVRLFASRDGEPTGAHMEWPLNRWHALVFKSQLTLKTMPPPEFDEDD